MGGGGYVAGPVGVAALSMRIPLVLTEADSHLGLTNRLLAPFARRVCLAFALPGREGARYRVTGRPVPPPARDRAAARARFGVAPDETCVLVFGGSLGARSINLAAVEAFAGAPFHVLHVSGRRDHAELDARALPADYDLREYLDLGDFADALAAADLVVARSGGSVFEIAAHGLPAVLVPYPHASADHQSENARWMADAGAAVVIPDAELSGRAWAARWRSCWRTASACGRWRRRRAASRGRTRRARWPRSCWKRRRRAARAAGGEPPDERRRRAVERAAPALRGRGRRGHERVRARGARARRGGQRLGRGGRPVPGAAGRGRRAGGACRPPRGERAGGRGRGGLLLLGGGGGERRAPRGARAGHSRAPARGAAGRAERDAPHDRGGGHARQDDDGVDDRARAARGGHAAGMAGGGADRRRLGERGVGGGRVAGGGGGRVRPLDAEPERGDRGADERRARPPRDVRVAGAAARGVRRVPGAGAGRRWCGIGRSCWSWRR